MRLRHAVVAILLTAIASLSPAEADAPLKIRVAWIAAPANLAPILFAKEGIARHLGQSYVLEPLHFQSTPSMITAIASGDLDIADLAYSSFATAVENAGLSDLRVIADDFQDGVDDYFTDDFLVLKDSPIKTVEDLKGKVLASNGFGGAIDITIRAMMRKHHMEDKKDYTLVEVALPNMKAVLAARKVDLVPGVIPFGFDPELRRISRSIFTQKEAVGTTQTLLWAARSPYLQEHRAAMVDFMEDVLRSRRFYLDPVNHQEVVEIVAKFTKQPASFYDSWVFTKKDTYRDPAGLPNIKAMQANVDLQHELGFLRAPLDVKAHADLSIVEEAGRRLH